MSACAVATEPAYSGPLGIAGDNAAAGSSSSTAGSSTGTGADTGFGGNSSLGPGGSTNHGGSANAGGAMSNGEAGKASGGSANAGGAHAGGSSSGGGSTGSAGTGNSAGASSGGGAQGNAGASTGGGTSLGFGDPWTFDTSLQGWAVRDHSANITTMPTATGGVASFAGLPFTMASEYSDFAFSFGSDVDLTGRTIHAKIRRVSGGFVGAQVYAYGGAWNGGTFTSLNSASFQDVTSAVLSGGSGFDPTKISRIGIKLNTGSNSANTFSATTIEIDEVTIE